MNPLVKKEIRLLLPAWVVAMLLALVQAITRPYDFYVASLLFFGLTIMALTPIGRETGLNTFSLLLAQPAERIRIWQTKISVLAIAFLIIFGVWLAAFGIAFINSNVDASDRVDSYNLFITICLIATATFTGGLWTTLLLRQLAGAFWLTLLVPAVLAGTTAAFLAENHSDNAIIAVLCVVLGIYSVGGFLFARWLFFRAQDVGWSGGVISLPNWQFSAGRLENGVLTRNRKPIFALVKKELQLQQVSLMGAAGLLVLHVGVILLRSHHKFARDSAGEILTSIFWMLWLVLPVVIGAMAVAEERRLGIMEGQLCLPVSRRVQFAIKGFLTLFLGIFLGGVMPMFLEYIAIGFGAHNSVFTPAAHTGEFGVLFFQLSIVAFSAWLALGSFLASSLAKNFLQAVGYASVTFIGFAMIIPAFVGGRMLFYGSMPMHSILPLITAVPTIIVTLPWLAYLNFKNFPDGWPLWRRNLLGVAGAIIFIAASSSAIYNRAWEIFEPAEPPHGPARFSLANPPALRFDPSESFRVQLPGGRVWVSSIENRLYSVLFDETRWQFWRWGIVSPLPKSGEPQRFITGSNWVSVAVQRYEYPANRALRTVGIQTDGSLWLSVDTKTGKQVGNKMTRLGNESNWQQTADSPAGTLLLKNDGTLWRWEDYDWNQWEHLPALKLKQVGVDSNWKELFNTWPGYARKNDGSVWVVEARHGKESFQQEANLDQVAFRTLSLSGNGEVAYVRPDGTLWMSWDYQQNGTNVYSGFFQVGTETNWTAVTLNWQKMVALKSDGSLWQWRVFHPQNMSQGQLILAAQEQPTRLGIHNDWVAIANTWEDVIALAADGSMWLWPNRDQYEPFTLLKLPKQPQLLGNVFGKSN